MKKHRLISAILSAAMMIACTAAPFPQGMIHPFTSEMSVYAASEIYTTPDGYRYKIDTVNKTASFIGYFSYGEELVIPSKVTAVIKDSYELECTVTNFDIGSLYVASEELSHGYITQIKKITIPGTIKNIGLHFLQDFYSDGWYSLDEIVLEEGVETIDSYAFDVRHPTKITLPSTIKNIHTYAFSDSFVKKGVLYGYSGTIAESFAKYKGIAFVTLGDAPSPTETPTTPSETEKPEPPTETSTAPTESNPPTLDLEISAASVTLEEGEQYTITANQSGLNYKSNNTDVAVVSKKGVVTAIGAGSAIITVINADGDAVTLRVTVTAAQQAITETATSTTAAVPTTTITTTTVVPPTDEPHEEYLLGDCNSDGRFNLIDLINLQKWLLFMPNINLYNWKAADFNQDGVIDVIDLGLMKRALLKKI